MTATSQKHKDPFSEDTLYEYRGELKKAIEIAAHYGFTLSRPLCIEKEDRAHEDRHRCPAQYVSALRTFVTNDVHQGNVVLAAHTRKVPYKKDLELRLDVIGDRESSAEGLVFRTIQAILQEYGHRNLVATVNSIGGRESVISYVQALQNYYRPRLGDLEASCRESFKDSVFSPLRCNHQRCLDLRADAPQSLNYLSEPSREHFKEVLEYLESLDISYTVDPFLLAPEHYTSRTIFSFAPAHDDAPMEEPLVYGERYDTMSRKIGHKKGVPALQATFNLGIRTPRERFILLKKPPKSPLVYVVQVGLQAKIKTLLVGESLRRAHIRVKAALHHNSVSEQMNRARMYNVPMIVIIGQKEVYEGTALVRHLNTNQQDSVPLGQLASYIKDRARRA